MKQISLAVITFKFSQPRRWKQLGFDLYRAEHVNALYRQCAANITIPHRFVCLTDDPESVECETMPVFPVVHVRGEDACYRRLNAFDTAWQKSLGTDFILMLDLDAVFLGDVTPIIRKAAKHDLTILEGSRWRKDALRGTMCSHYNGSMWLCRAGTHEFLWTEFDPETFYDEREAYRMPNGQRPLGSDQAWYSVRLGDSTNMFTAPEVIQFRGSDNPEDVSLVFFAGNEKPWGPSVASTSRRLAATWQCYAENRVKPYHKHRGGRCLILGDGPDIWTEAEAAMSAGPVDGVIASPEAALHWPVPVDAIALDAGKAIERAEWLGFKETALCGYSEGVMAA